MKINEDYTAVVMDKLPQCDLHSLDSGPVAATYDGQVKTREWRGVWAYMCEECFQQHGAGLGLGKGQRLLLSEEMDGDLDEATWQSEWSN